MKSDYELQRDENIARNQAVLKALGLGGDNALQVKAAVKPRAQSVQVSDEERRRSSRVSKQPVTFQQLSHEFCDAEERRAEGREQVRAVGSRKRSAPMSYQDEQQREIEQREAKAAERRAQVERVKKEAERAARAKLVQERGSLQVLAQAAAHVPIVDDNAQRPPHQHAYPTLSQRARCPLCKGIFVLTAKGQLHKHDCRPTRPVVAFM